MCSICRWAWANIRAVAKPTTSTPRVADGAHKGGEARNADVVAHRERRMAGGARRAVHHDPGRAGLEGRAEIRLEAVGTPSVPSLRWRATAASVAGRSGSSR